MSEAETMTQQRSFWATLKAYRWPLYLTGLLGMSVTAQGVLVFVATRPDAPRPVQGSYEHSQHWDEDEALRGASDDLGWSVRFHVPEGPEYTAGMPRPIDVEIRDRDQRAVTGLSGEVIAIRPSDHRLDDRATLVELPHEPGRYRGLVHLGAPGIWAFNVDARRGGLHFVHGTRVSLAPSSPTAEAAE